MKEIEGKIPSQFISSTIDVPKSRLLYDTVANVHIEYEKKKNQMIYTQRTPTKWCQSTKNTENRIYF